MTLKQAGLAIPILLVLLIVGVSIISNTPLNIRVLSAATGEQGPPGPAGPQGPQGVGDISIFTCTEIAVADPQDPPPQPDQPTRGVFSTVTAAVTEVPTPWNLVEPPGCISDATTVKQLWTATAFLNPAHASANDTKHTQHCLLYTSPSPRDS